MNICNGIYVYSRTHFLVFQYSCDRNRMRFGVRMRLSMQCAIAFVNATVLYVSSTFSHGIQSIEVQIYSSTCTMFSDDDISNITGQTAPSMSEKSRKDKNKREPDSPEKENRKRLKMTNEEKHALAACIDDEQIIYDKQNRHHRDSNHTKRAWARIAQKLNLPGEY